MDQLVFIFIIIIFLWLSALTFYLYKIAVHYLRLLKDTKKENLSQILEEILVRQKENKGYIDILKKELSGFQEENIYNIQKVGIIRFNPFEDTGGDQSFVLAILDGSDNGIVLTSLHNRGITRWYAKNVKGGQGVDHKLSEEEELAIKKAASWTKRKK